jgi:hypothetical protein
MVIRFTSREEAFKLHTVLDAAEFKNIVRNSREVKLITLPRTCIRDVLKTTTPYE